MGGSILLGRSDYQRSGNSPLTLRNAYFEKTPTNIEDEVSIRPRPRLTQFTTAGAGPIRGMFRKGNVLTNSGFSGNIICRSGDSIYRVHQTTGVATLIGTVEGTLRMTAEGNEDVVVMCFGTKAYETDGNAVTEIAMPDSLGANGVDALNGYFIIASDLGRFYWTDIGGTTVDPLNYATAESQPDVLLTLKVIGDEVWLFGRQSIEPWQPTGDLDLPFQRIGGRIFGIGVTGRETVQKFSQQGVDKVCWVGTDSRVYMTDPNPVEISDAAMIERLRGVTDPALLYASLANDAGHDFYILHLTDDLGSWAYDLTTGSWAEWTSYERDNFRGGTSSLAPNNRPLMGDDTSNVIWTLTQDEREDAGGPFVQEWSGLLRVPGPPMRCNSVLVGVATGLTIDPDDDPMLTMDWTDDRGLTYNDPVQEPLGRQGQFLERVMFTQCGLLKRPGRTFRNRTTLPVVVESMKYNEGWR